MKKAPASNSSGGNIRGSGLPPLSKTAIADDTARMIKNMGGYEVLFNSRLRILTTAKHNGEDLVLMLVTVNTSLSQIEDVTIKVPSTERQFEYARLKNKEEILKLGTIAEECRRNLVDLQKLNIKDDRSVLIISGGKHFTNYSVSRNFGALTHEFTSEFSTVIVGSVVIMKTIK